MEKTIDTIDLQWKFKAVDLAAMEQIDAKGKLELKKLFKRANEIYAAGHASGILEWDTVFKADTEEQKTPIAPITNIKVDKKPEQKPVEKKVVETEQPKTGFKKCRCGEMVPVAWKKHMFMKDGGMCGHSFE